MPSKPNVVPAPAGWDLESANFTTRFPVADDPFVSWASWLVGTAQVASTCEFAGIPATAGPPIVPLTCLTVVTVAVTVTVVALGVEVPVAAELLLVEVVCVELLALANVV